MMLGTKAGRDDRMRPQCDGETRQCPEEAVTIPSAGLKLSGIVRVPERHAGRASGARPSWCCTASAATRPPSNVMQPTKVLSELGYVTLRFDMRGCGDSEGEFGRVICLEQVEDTRNALTLPGQASRRRSRTHRRDRIELRRRRRRLCRRRRRAGRGRDLERRLGRRRAQVPRPAQERRRNGRASPRCSRKAASTAPGPASR